MKTVSLFKGRHAPGRPAAHAILTDPALPWRDVCIPIFDACRLPDLPSRIRVTAGPKAPVPAAFLRQPQPICFGSETLLFGHVREDRSRPQGQVEGHSSKRPDRAPSAGPAARSTGFCTIFEG